MFYKTWISSIAFLFAQQFFCIDLVCIEGKLIDLEEGTQDFVLDTQKIEIPGCRYAYNPSIVRWRDGVLMSFRYKLPSVSDSKMGLIWLDENMSLRGRPQTLIIGNDFSSLKNIEDARLIVHRDHLFAVFNDGASLEGGCNRMILAEIDHNGTRFSIKSIEKLSNYDGCGEGRVEKNWSPFIFNDQIFFSYTLSPHRIFYPIYENNRCETLTTTEGHLDWKWGELRGGTPSLLINDQYFGFFHTCAEMSSLHSQGNIVRHYFIGAYTFSNTPPFALTQISPSPIIGKNFYHGMEYKIWGGIRVLFPGGFIFNDEYIWMAYGRQDHEIWIAKMDKKALLESLVFLTP